MQCVSDQTWKNTAGGLPQKSPFLEQTFATKPKNRNSSLLARSRKRRSRNPFTFLFVEKLPETEPMKSSLMLISLGWNNGRPLEEPRKMSSETSPSSSQDIHLNSGLHFPSTFLMLKAHLKCFRVKCDQDGWNVQEDLRKESTTTFHKVFTKFKHWLAWTPEKQN